LGNYDRKGKERKMTIEEMLIKHEGLRLKPYMDSTGNLTIGVGRNLERGITAKEAAILLDNDIKNVKAQLTAIGSVYNDLSATRKMCLEDMCFNMGIKKLLGFRKMFIALSEKDYEKAAEEMLKSKWAQQVKGRSKELAALMKKNI
jgi:lysozyme